MTMSFMTVGILMKLVMKMADVDDNVTGDDKTMSMMIMMIMLIAMVLVMTKQMPDRES